LGFSLLTATPTSRWFDIPCKADDCFAWIYVRTSLFHMWGMIQDRWWRCRRRLNSTATAWMFCSWNTMHAWRIVAVQHSGVLIEGRFF
jgi:hypothetical protein